MKKICLYLALIGLALSLAGCTGTSEDSADELKGYITHLGVLVEGNVELFNSVQDIFLAHADDEFNMSGTTVCVGESNIELSKTDIFSDEEKEMISKLFALSESNVRIQSYNSTQFFIAWDNLVDLRLQKIANEQDLAVWTERAYYIEEVAENWYAYIIISKPN